MAISFRSLGALGLGLVGVAGMVGVSLGQGDGDVRKTAANAGTAPAAAARLAPTVVGSIDLEAIFRTYEKTKFHMEQLRGESLVKEGELKTFITEARQITEEMKNFQPGTQDFKTRDAKLTQLKASLQAVKETAEREGQAKYAEIMATFYKEVQDMTRNVAKYKGITYVMRVSNEPVDSLDPEGVMAAMARPVVYSDPANDITSTVVYNLNLAYQKAGGQMAKNPAPGSAEAGVDPAAAAPAPAPRTPAPATAAPRPTGGQAVPR